jgi:membrane protein DedA with SNARE-associated domain
MLQAILQPLIEWVTYTIGVHGLLAVFILMLLESTGIPIPSEAISPFAGYLVSQAKMSFLGALGAGVAGNMAGSWLAYLIGLFGGREIWLRYGRYIGVREGHLKLAERWFEHYGELAVFISRCLPVVRTFISFPAGTARMSFLRFSIYTLFGCVPWVFGLTYLGYELGESWERVGEYIRYLDYLVALGIVGGFVYYLFVRPRSSRKASQRRRGQ